VKYAIPFNLSVSECRQEIDCQCHKNICIFSYPGHISRSHWIWKISINIIKKIHVQSLIILKNKNTSKSSWQHWYQFYYQVAAMFMIKLTEQQYYT